MSFSIAVLRGIAMEILQEHMKPQPLDETVNRFMGHGMIYWYENYFFNIFT